MTFNFTVLANACQDCLDAGNTPAECAGVCQGNLNPSGNPINNIFGKINPPPGVDKFSPSGDLAGLAVFFNNIIKFVIVVAGIYAFVNIVLAGFAFMSAGDDPKKMAAAWGKIWQSILGLTIAAGSFILAAIFGQLIFGEWSALLQLRIFSP